jgi:hypothetical protein
VTDRNLCPMPELAPVEHAPLLAKGGELQCDSIYFEYRLPGSLSSIYLRVLSPLALTALRDWTPMELAWR